MEKKNYKDVIGSGLLLLFFGGFYLMSMDVNKLCRTYPQLICIIGMVLVAVNMGRAFYRLRKNKPADVPAPMSKDQLLSCVIAVALTALYSFLKYHALGDLDIFIIFGVLTVLGMAYAATGTWRWDALVLSVPIGIITVSVLHANNTYDIPSDKAAGIKTFAMVIGEKASAVLYCCYMVLPFLCIILAVIVGWLPPMALLCLLAGLKAFRNLKQAATYKTAGREAMKALDFHSSQLQLQFSLLLSVGLIISHWL